MDETMELPEETERVMIVEGSLPSCYCWQKEGHIKKSYPQHVQENQVMEIASGKQGYEAIGTELTVQDTSQDLDKEFKEVNTR